MSTSNNQADGFKALVNWLRDAIREPEQFTLSYAAESSAFVRFNHAKVRQAGQVQQASIGFKLINDGRHADLDITLAGDPEVDVQRLAEGLQQLRDTLPLLPQDPYLLLNHNGWQSKNVQEHPLPDTEQVVAEITRAWWASMRPGQSVAVSPVPRERSAGIRPTVSTSTSACFTKTAKR